MQHDRPQQPSSRPDRAAALRSTPPPNPVAAHPLHGETHPQADTRMSPPTRPPSAEPRRWLWGLLVIAALVPLLVAVCVSGVFLTLNSVLEARVEQVMREIDPAVNDRSSATSTPASTAHEATRDLAPLLIAAGDLPPDYHARTPTSTLPPMFQTLPLPRAEQQLDQRFMHEGKVAGGVTAFHFAAQADDAYATLAAQLAEDAATAEMKAMPVREVGEQAVAGLMRGSSGDTYDLVFQRGCVVAYIRMDQVEDINDLIAYAKRLDQRLRLVVCG